MTLDRRERAGPERVEKRDAGVRKPACVEHHAVSHAARRVEPVDERPLVVGLKARDGRSTQSTLVHDRNVNLRERGVTVNFWFADTEKVEVWTVQDEHAPSRRRHVGLSSVRR